MKNPHSVFVFHKKLVNDTELPHSRKIHHCICILFAFMLYPEQVFYSACRSINFQKSLTLLSWLEPGNISCPPFYFFIAEESTWGRYWNWCTLRHTNCNSTCIIYTHWFITKYCHLQIALLRQLSVTSTAIQDPFSNIICIINLT